MFGGLAGEIKELQVLVDESLSDDELIAAVVELERLSSAFDATRTQLLAKLDASRAWALSGARSCPMFVAIETRRPRAECGARLALGRKLRHLPLVAVAWAAGDISEAHARRIASAHNRRTAEHMARDEAVLVHDAQTLPFHEFQQAMAYWELHADPDGADDREKDRGDRRRASFDTTLDGMGVGSILLDPVRAEIFGNELRRLQQLEFEAERARLRAMLGRDPKAGEYERTPQQRRADALVEMAKRSASPTGSTTARPLFQVVMGSDALRHLIELANGTVVSPAALVPYLSEADLERYLFDGTPNRVISVTYRRRFTGALRDLIHVRERWCYHRYCDERAIHCQADHITPWAEGGITAQHNGRPACGHHNRWRHQRPPPPPDTS